MEIEIFTLCVEAKIEEKSISLSKPFDRIEAAFTPVKLFPCYVVYRVRFQLNDPPKINLLLRLHPIQELRIQAPTFNYLESDVKAAKAKTPTTTQPAAFTVSLSACPVKANDAKCSQF